MNTSASKSETRPHARTADAEARDTALDTDDLASDTAAPAQDDDTKSTRQPRSLFGEILVSMFIPLFLAWLLSIGAIYLIAQSLANYPFDHALENNLRVLAQQVHLVNDKVELNLPTVATDLLRADHADPNYFQVLGPAGERIAGDALLPPPSAEEWPTPGQVLFRTVTANRTKIRIASMLVEEPAGIGSETSAPNPANPGSGSTAGNPLPLVQLGESLTKRSDLTVEIIKGVVLPQFVIVPIAVVLVWFGLYRGIRTLSRLQERIVARAPSDLRPIDPHEAPEEMTPLVDSFNQLLARLEHNISDQKRFIADAAHQMRTPLAGLRTQAELALRQTDPAEIQRSLNQLATSSERATRLINQLLALAHAEQNAEHPGRVRNPLAPVELEMLARDVVRDWVPAALEKPIDIGFESTGGSVLIAANELLLRELLKNLIDNALHYTPASGTVTVRIATDHDPHTGRGTALLEVEDNGPGIAESERVMVFERFYRVMRSDPYDNILDGSGLGLAIVREIAQQHGARIVLGNNPACTDPQRPGLSIKVIFPLLVSDVMNTLYDDI